LGSEQKEWLNQIEGIESWYEYLAPSFHKARGQKQRANRQK
jgi:hypothetical protein